MKYIGGYFGLELPEGKGGLHRGALPLNTARACFAAILQAMRPRRVYMPFYMCEGMFAPAREAGVPIVFYSLNADLVPYPLPKPRRNELLLVVNYFGVQSSLVQSLARRFGSNFIADNTQAYFERGTPGSWAICSARKFFGVPDGAYLYSPDPIELRPRANLASDVRHLVNRLVGRQQTGYRQVRKYEKRMDWHARAMSTVTERLLSVIDYEAARRRRRENYMTLHRALKSHNRFDATLPGAATPFCYPLLLDKPVDRRLPARERLYIPTLWPDVIESRSRKFAFERAFAARLLPLPIDQRYDTEDMQDALRRLRKTVAL